MQDDYTPAWLGRLLAKVDAYGDCWTWTASCLPGGYARFRLGSRTVYPHRLMYEWLVGPIPLKYEIDHLCRVRHCVNPDHLEAVPHRVNARRGYGAWALAARHRLRTQTHCAQGHPFSAPNEGLRKTGRRVCPRCNREQAQRSRDKARAGAAACKTRAASANCLTTTP